MADIVNDWARRCLRLVPVRNDSTLLGLGKASIGELVPDDLIVPPDFTR